MKKLIFTFALAFLLTTAIMAQNNSATNSTNTKDDSSQAENLFNQGVDYYGAKDYKKAIKLWEEAAKSMPDEPAVFYGLGLAYYNTRQYTKSVAAFQRVISIDPNYRSAQQNLATAESAKTAEKEKQKAMWSGVLNAVSEATTSDESENDNKTQNGDATSGTGSGLLSGRYRSSRGMLYYTFHTDGTFVKATAGGTADSVYGTERPGTYVIQGNTITLKFSDGAVDQFPFEILENKDLKINGLTFWIWNN